MTNQITREDLFNEDFKNFEIVRDKCNQAETLLNEIKDMGISFDVTIDNVEVSAKFTDGMIK